APVAPGPAMVSTGWTSTSVAVWLSPSSMRTAVTASPVAGRMATSAPSSRGVPGTTWIPVRSPRTATIRARAGVSPSMTSSAGGGGFGDEAGEALAAPARLRLEAGDTRYGDVEGGVDVVVQGDHVARAQGHDLGGRERDLLEADADREGGAVQLGLERDAQGEG